MRRAQIILVILALLCAPLSLLAQTGSDDMSACGGMCCLPHHGMHHPASHHPAATQVPAHQSAACEHGGAAQMPNCGLHCSDTPTQHVYVSPIAPTKASNLVSVARLNLPKNIELRPETPDAVSGFLAEPFQPPRA
ncbi:MAG TPA: hypothetical protein VGD60_18820 [Candidatus Acidoferrales bacterium]